MDFATGAKYTFQLLTNKKLAAVICVAWVILRLSLAYSPQFAELLADCHKYVATVDLIGSIAAASLIVELTISACSYVSRKCKHRSFDRARLETVEGILQSRNSEKYIILVHLYHFPNSQLNPLQPAIKTLRKTGILCYTSNIATRSINGLTLIACDLTDPVREHMDAHRDQLPSRDLIASLSPYKTTDDFVNLAKGLL